MIFLNYIENSANIFKQLKPIPRYYLTADFYGGTTRLCVLKINKFGKS